VALFVILDFTGVAFFGASEDCFSAAVSAACFLCAIHRAEGVGANWFVEEGVRKGAGRVIFTRDSSGFNDQGVVVPVRVIVHSS
jgi:hypothetical protein